MLLILLLPFIITGCLQSTERSQKLQDITRAVLEELTSSCADCRISIDIIDRQSFTCFPESPTYVTFRARLGSNSEIDSGSLISLLESWVSGGATIIVTGVLMSVDAECSVAISSLSEGECSMTTTQPPDTINTMTTSDESTTASNSQSSTDNTAAIIGGVVAIVLILAVTVLIFGALKLVLKSRHRKLTITNANR